MDKGACREGPLPGEAWLAPAKLAKVQRGRNIEIETCIDLGAFQTRSTSDFMCRGHGWSGFFRRGPGQIDRKRPRDWLEPAGHQW